MEIQAYCDSDRAAVIALWDQVFPNPAPHNQPARTIDLKQAVEDHLLFVARDELRIIGTVMGGYDGHRGWVYALAVAPEKRRLGVGRQLMQHLEHELKRRGCEKVNLQVRADNESVLTFYLALGYDTEDRISLGKFITS